MPDGKRERRREVLVTLVIVGCVIVVYIWVKSYTAPIQAGQEKPPPALERPFQ